MECFRSFTVKSLGSFMVLFLVSVGIHKHIFTGCDGVAGCPTAESDCWSNKELMNQQANVVCFFICSNVFMYPVVSDSHSNN